MPKGRVTLELANAAELAIGHTMLSPRDELASRLALSMADSSVVNRLHIPQSAITIIDTLDRSPAALDHTHRTIGHLPNARRAFLKFGGEFPYISVPDEVNVHLIVHLRRHAPLPQVDLPVPVPAKPMVLPLSARRRRELEEALRRASEAQVKEANPKGTPNQAKRVRRSPEQLLHEAKLIIESEERQNIERYAFEIGRLREFLPGKTDAYLAAVLDDCDDNLDSAISNALDEQYTDVFYQDAVNQAIEKTLEELSRAEQEGIQDETDQQNDDGIVEDGKREETANIASGIGGGPLGPPDSNHVTEDGVEDIVTIYRSRGVLTKDPLVETAFPTSNIRTEEGETGGVNVDDDKNTTDADSAMAASPDAKLSGSDSESAEMRDDDPLAGLNTTNGAGSVMSSVDLGAKAFYGTTDKRQRPQENDTQSEGKQSPKKLESGSGDRRNRRSRRNSFPQAADSVDEYVSSEKVGMRSQGPLIGRGPAPFHNASVGSSMSPGDSWVRTARPLDEESPTIEEKPDLTLASGASLLESDDNPLELPRHGSAYSSERHTREGSGSQSRGSTTPFPSRQGGAAAQAQDSGFMASEPEVLIRTEGKNMRDSSAMEHDEWEKFRRRESHKGLAGVFYSPPRPGSVERRLDKTFEGKGTEMESEEAARLREWAMSAQAASKNVHR